MDNQAPTVACPANTTVINTDGSGTCSITIPNYVTMLAPTDNCSASVTENQDIAAGAYSVSGDGATVTVNYTATDGALPANTTTCTVTITVNDDDAPVISGCPVGIALTTGAGDTDCQTAATWTAPTATDNCDLSLSTTNSHTSGALFGLGLTTVTYTFTDDAANTSTCSFTVTVTDNTFPVISGCPSNIALTTGPGDTDCQTAATWTAPTAVDNCDLSLATTNSHTSGALFGLGMTTVSYTFTDDAANTSTCSFTVTVTDNTFPVISGCPSNIPLTTGAGDTDCQTAATWTAPTAADNCVLSLATTNSHTSGDLFGLGLTTVTYTFTDDAGNTSTCSFTVTVTDNAFPVISGCPSAIALTTGPGDTDCQTATTWTAPTAADNCDLSLATTNSHNSGDLFGLGMTTVTYTFTDDAANTSTCSFTVTVTDNTFPVISGCPLNIALTTGASDTDCQTAATWAAPTAADNCDLSLSATNSHTRGDLFGLGLTTVTYTFTDDAGNTSTCSFTVTVIDNTPPTIICPTNQTVAPTSTTPCSAVVNGINGSYSDNCSGSALAYALSGATTGSGSGQAGGQTFLAGVTTVTYTVTDGANLTSSCVFTVTVTNCNITFAGTIKWEHDGTSGVNNATVNLTGAGTGNNNTNTNGDYLISIPYATGNFTVKPVKNINRMNGVTAADVTAIQQHLTTVNPITNPYKLVAADINRSNSISTFDANILSQCLTGNPSALAQFSVFWRFMPQTHNLVMPPWGFPEQLNLTGVSTNQTGLNFKGVKIGDVVSTWANPANFGKGEPLVWQVQDRVLQAGETVEAEFRADQLDDLTAFQFALQFDPARLRLDSVESLGGLPALGPDNFGTYNLAGGEIRVVWAGNKALALGEATPVFRLRFTALQGGQRLSEALKLDAAEDTELPARVYNSALAESGVELRYWETTGAGPAGKDPVFGLYAAPSPFVGQTTLYFTLPRAGEAELRVHDAAGRLLTSKKQDYAAGAHSETLRLGDAAPGVLFVELRSAGNRTVQRVVCVR